MPADRDGRPAQPSLAAPRARSNSQTRIALARLAGSGASIRAASIRATSAESGSACSRRRLDQRVPEDRLEADRGGVARRSATERLTGPAMARVRAVPPQYMCWPPLIDSVDPVTKPAILGDQEGDAARDLVGLAEPADRDLGDDLLQHVGRHRRDHVGVDIARRDRVDGDAELRAFLRQRLGEAVDARFGGGVVDLAVLPGLAVDRADVDDPAPAALAHAGERRLGHVEAAAEIGVDHLPSTARRSSCSIVLSRVMPALLTTTSTGPSSASTLRDAFVARPRNRRRPT